MSTTGAKDVIAGMHDIHVHDCLREGEIMFDLSSSCVAFAFDGHVPSTKFTCNRKQ